MHIAAAGAEKGRGLLPGLVIVRLAEAEALELALGEGIATAAEVAVAVGVVHAGAAGPELVKELAGGRVGSLAAGVGVGPFVRSHGQGGVRGVHHHVVVGGHGAFSHGGHFAVDANHGVHEAVELVLAFGFGGFDHEGIMHREAHGGGVEAVVHESLGHIVHGEVALGEHDGGVQDALVGHQTALARVEGREVVLQALGHVVGVEDGHLGGELEALVAHHGEPHPGDGAESSGAVLGGGDSGGFLGIAGDAVVRQVGGEVLSAADGAHAGAAATVRHGEGLVQVQVAHVGTDGAGVGKADLGVHVGAVHVDLAAVFVDDAAELGHAAFVHAVGGGIGDHEGGEVVAVLLGLGLEVGGIDVALLIAFHGHHGEAGHGGGGGVGAVGGVGDEADVAVPLPLGHLVAVDGEQACIFAGSAAVGLQGDAVETGDSGEPLLELLEHGAHALALVHRGKGMQGGDLRPGDGHHDGGAVGLHGAGAERNHGFVQRQVLGLQAVDVAHHLGFGVEGVEALLGAEGAGAGEGGIPHGLGRHVLAAGLLHAQGLAEGLHIAAGGGLVKGDGDGIGIHQADVVASLQGGGRHVGSLAGGLHLHGVEEVGSTQGVTGLGGGGGETGGQLVGGEGHVLQPLGALVHGVEGAEQGGEHLGGADVGGSLLAADVLLAGLQGQAVGGLAVLIHREADEAAGQLALQRIGAGHVGGGGATVAHGDTEALGGAHAHIGAEGTGFLEHGEGQQVGRHAAEHLGVVALGKEVCIILHGAGVIRVLHEHTGQGRDGGGVEALPIAHDELHAGGLAAGADDIDGLREAGIGHEEGIALALGIDAEVDGLGGGGAFIEHGGIGHGQPGEAGNHGLEVHEHLQAALGDFRLVGGVSGVPARVLIHIALDDGGHVGAVVALADEAVHGLVGRKHLAQGLQGLLLGHGGGQIQRGLQADIGGHDGIGHFIQTGEADELEHLLHIRTGGAHVARGKGSLSSNHINELYVFEEKEKAAFPAGGNAARRGFTCRTPRKRRRPSARPARRGHQA